MTKDTTLEASLLLMRLAIAAFLLVWAIDKLIVPEHAKAVFAHFYRVADLSPGVLTALGLAQLAVIATFAAGFAKFWTYGAVLLMHSASTISTWETLIHPWAEGSQLLFWAAVPVLAAMIVLFLLRDRDRMLAVDTVWSR